MPHKPTASDHLTEKHKILEAEARDAKGHQGLLARIQIAQLAALVAILALLEAKG